MDYSLEVLHPVNGKWVHIGQVTIAKKRYYYTDGKLEHVAELTDDCHVVPDFDKNTCCFFK